MKIREAMRIMGPAFLVSVRGSKKARRVALMGMSLIAHEHAGAAAMPLQQCTYAYASMESWCCAGSIP